MSWLLILAGTMAIFGVIGYLRGTRAAMFILIMSLLAVAVTGALGDVIIKYLNAFAKGFQFLLSGGLSVLAGSGSADQAIAALQDTPALITEENAALVLALISALIVLFAVLVSGWSWFRPKRSVAGLFLGLIAGYVVAAMLVRGFAPEYAALVPLPFGTPAPAGPIVIIPGAEGPSLTQRILIFLNDLAAAGLITAFLGIVIAIFLLVGIRSGRRSSGERKG